MSSQNMKKFAGFAKSAFEKLKHPVDSIIRYAADSSIYWSTIGVNIKNRSMFLNYFDGIAKTATLLSMGAGIALSGPILAPYTAAACAAVIGVHVKSYFSEYISSVALRNRGNIRINGDKKFNFNPLKEADDDTGKARGMGALLSDATRFMDIMDIASRRGKNKKILADASLADPKSSLFLSRLIRPVVDYDDNKVFISNIQKCASQSIDSLDRADELYAARISDQSVKADCYRKMAHYANEMSQRSLIIPHTNDTQKSFGDVYREKAEHYTQIANTIEANTKATLVNCAAVTLLFNATQDIQKFNKSPAIRGALHQAKAMGLPPRQAFMMSVSSKPDLNAQYSALQNNVVQALTQAQDAVDTGLITIGSPDSQRMVASLDAIHDGSKLWSMSPVKAMVSKILSTLRPTSSPDAGQAHVNSQNSQPNGSNRSSHVRTMQP